MNTPRFSIIIPIYKVEKYLDRCVRSAINQSYTNIELVLVDDGSPDNCPTMCDEYAKADNRIKVIHKPNGGLSDARNVGIAVATGEYILLLDSDDYIDTDTCEKLLPYTERMPDIIVGQARVEGADFELDNKTNFVTGTGYDYLKKVVFEDKAQMAAWLYVFRRIFLMNNKLEFKKGILHEDEQFTPRALLASKSVVATGVCFYHYVIRADSITTKTDKRKNVLDIYNTGMELTELFSVVSEKKFRKFLCDRMVRAYLNNFYSGNAYTYGKDYIHKKFVLKYGKRFKTRIHALIFALSPKLYCKFISLMRGEKA